MNSKKLRDIISDSDIISTRGSLDTEITGLTFDSRRVKGGYLFTAMPGSIVNGHKFIPSAIEKGASAVIHSEDLLEYRENITYIKVKDPRFLLSSLSAGFYDFPSEKMFTIGVTGTDGKSTTVWLVHQLLEKIGRSSGFISTVEFQTGSEVTSNVLRQSTPEASDIHKMLDTMVSNGKTHAVIESTSHGLSPRTNRLGDISFNAGIFTNLSHEHLEFHGTLEQYRDDKANLFRKITDFGIVNADDPNYVYFAEAARVPVYTYSTKTAEADIYAENIKSTEKGIRFTVVYNRRKSSDFQQLSCQGEINLHGKFNVDNVLAAALVVLESGIGSLEDVVSLLPELTAPPGRMTPVRKGQSFTVLVDYAHTPGSFNKIFPMLKEECGNKLIALFGSAGDRDVEKRPIQGKIAASYADYIILSDEDPRHEDPMVILEDIAAGCEGLKIRDKDLFLIPNRKKGIEKAFSLAGPGDTVILLGKGHEKSIIHGDDKIPWDEIEIAANLLS